MQGTSTNKTQPIRLRLLAALSLSLSLSLCSFRPPSLSLSLLSSSRTTSFLFAFSLLQWGCDVPLSYQSTVGLIPETVLGGMVGAPSASRAVFGCQLRAAQSNQPNKIFRSKIMHFENNHARQLISITAQA